MSQHREKISFLLSFLELTSKISSQFIGMSALMKVLARQGLISGGFEMTALEQISDSIISNYNSLTEKNLIDSFEKEWTEEEIDQIILIMKTNPLFLGLFLKVGKMGKDAHNKAMKKISTGITALSVKFGESSEPLGFNDPSRRLTKKPLD